MSEEAGQVILVPRLGTNEVVAISGAPGTTAMDLVFTGDISMPACVGQPGTVLPGLLERVLDGMGAIYRRKNEETFFTMSKSDSGEDLAVWFRVVGDERDILRIICTNHRTIPKRDWQRALARCNSFHAQFRFGRVYLEEGRSDGVLRFDAQLLVPEGVTEGLVKEFIYSNLVCAHHFFGTEDTGGSPGARQSQPSRRRLPAEGKDRKRSKLGFVRG